MSEDLLDKEKEDLTEVLLETVNNANALSLMVSTTGWEILMNSLREKKEEQISILMETSPGDDTNILRLHAIAYAVAHTVDDVSNSVYSAIEQGKAARIALAELNTQYNQTDDEDNWS